MIKTSDPEVIKMKALISHAASALRMQTSRRLRAEVLRVIDEPNVLRIATILDTIKNYKDYVIIESAIADTIRMKDVRVGEEVQGIVFGDQTIPSKRTMHSNESGLLLGGCHQGYQYSFPSLSKLVDQASQVC